MCNSYMSYVYSDLEIVILLKWNFKFIVNFRLGAVNGTVAGILP